MHKSIALIIAITSVVSMSFADGVKFTKISLWSEALEMAKATGKPIFLDAYTDWCGWCKVMDRETFSNAKVAEVMNASFVCVKMEMETGEGIDVAMKYRIAGFPMFFVFTPEGLPTYRVSGYQPPEVWLVTLADMKDPSKRINAPGITANLKLPWPEWHRPTFVKGPQRKGPDSSVVRSWFASVPEKERFDEVAWSVMLRYDLGETWDQWALANESEFASRYGDETGLLHDRISQKYFARAVAGKDLVMLDKAASVANTSSPAEAEHLKLRYAAMYNQRLDNWAGVGNVVRLMSEEENVSEYANDINEFSWNIYEKSSDKSAIENAIWAMGQITKDPEADWALVDTYAALLYKSGRYDDALVSAERAITLGKAKGADVKETEALLVKIKATK
ncbi:MAG: DUF255 domain-containing protein [Candidatus Kapabacteria bacterium]|nr:DUF255 domain-containing protein [Candidatus Kapabacteria bacterium]